MTRLFLAQSYKYISRDLSHDHFFVLHCIRDLILKLAKEYPNLHTVFFQSDGCSSQFKGRSTFFHMAEFIAMTKKLARKHNLKFTNGLDLLWWFFASCHGKGNDNHISF